MPAKYIDLVKQTFNFPQQEFELKDKVLRFHDIDLIQLIEQYDTPLKFTYLPQISNNIERAKKWFKNAFEVYDYQGEYHYSYCTKSSHFKHVLNEVLTSDVHLETSSAFDIDIVKSLKKEERISNDTYVLCNGFKREQYISNIAELINDGHHNCIPIIDNFEEIDLLSHQINTKFKIGIRIAAEEEPKSEFYTSRLGVGYKSILPFYKEHIQSSDKVALKMLHFFISTGIRDDAYYWSELIKCLNVYTELKKLCPELDSLNIGGGFPIKNSLNFDFDYQHIVNEIVNQIQKSCHEAGVDTPHIFTEFGSFTVGESGGAIYKVLHQKQQNDREKWNMINSSFITTLPDTWAINKRFIMLPINRWNQPYEQVLLGGLTCDSEDYYNREKHVNAIYLPEYDKGDPLYIGFFNTGAYQESIGGFGGLQHCLIPSPKHLLIKYDAEGNLITDVFAEQQNSDNMLKILGYEKD